MPSCIVKGCTNYTLKCNKKKYKVSYHKFPRDPVRNEVWSRVIRKQRGEPYFQSNEYTRICSEHFTADSFYATPKCGIHKLKKSALPSLKVEPKVTAKPTQSSSPEADKGQLSKEDNLMDVDINELQFTIDTPRNVQLKRKIKKYVVRDLVKTKIIKRLQKQNAYLKKKNKSLLGIVKELKKKLSIID